MIKNKKKTLGIFVVGAVLIFVTSAFSTYFLFSIFSPQYNSPLPNQTQTNAPVNLAKELFSAAIAKLPKAYIIYSGSMEPAIKTGSIIITRTHSSYQKGDIISFTPKTNKQVITHRIEHKSFPEGINENPAFFTSGDANEDFDTWEITNADIIGKVVLTLPYLGYLANFAKTPQGFILFVIVPATIFIYEEARAVISEVLKRFKKILRKTTLTKKSGSRIPKVSMAIPVLGTLAILIGISGSFFFDKETGMENVLSAAAEFAESPTVTPTSTPTPTPTPEPTPSEDILVINEFLAAPNPEWVEFYNSSPSAEFIKNYFLDDDTDFVSDSGSSRIKSLSSLNTSNPSHPYLEFNSFLNNGGDFVVLFNADGDIIDQHQYISNPGNGVSIGRDPDGTGNFYPCILATKGTSNLGNCPEP